MACIGCEEGAGGDLNGNGSDAGDSHGDRDGFGDSHSTDNSNFDGGFSIGG